MKVWGGWGCGDMAATASKNLGILGTGHFYLQEGDHLESCWQEEAGHGSWIACAPGEKVHRRGLQGRLESTRKIQRLAPELMSQKMVQQHRRTIFSPSKSNAEFPCHPGKRMMYIHTSITVFAVVTFIIIQGSWGGGWLSHLSLLSQGTTFGTHQVFTSIHFLIPGVQMPCFVSVGTCVHIVCIQTSRQTYTPKYSLK